MRYAELDAPCHIHTHPYTTDISGHPRILITAHQHHTEIFTTILTHTPTPQH